MKPRMYSGVPQEERTRLRRRRLIDAGIEVFGRQGFARATMRDICAQSRLSERYFYESFKSTPEVFDTVFKHLVRDLMAAVSGAIMQAPPTEKTLLEAGLEAFLRFIRDDPRRVQIILIDGVWREQSKLREGQSELFTYQQVIETLTQGLHPRMSTEIDLKLAASGLVGTAVHTAIAWADTGFKADIDSIVKHNLFAWGGLGRWMKMTVPGSEVVPEQSELVAHVRSVFKPD
ncbi:TetR/AcrR family transcriptional regulator [Aquabacterium sp.]|uniref:TetR/AcrR family transcriptional regulator n=1 Tax=Aquabacterium sp. TaxID=1872578 RepID=UPI0025B9C137|nr:TetR/AcrR family transcriptional regulator [Aquabacterium sp.]